MKMSSPAGLTPPAMTVEEAASANMVECDGDEGGGVGGGDGEDGGAMEEEERGEDERVVDGKMEVGEGREKVGELYIIKDEIDVEDSIILSDHEYNLTDEDGDTDEDDDTDEEEGTVEDNEGENPLKNEQCNVSRSSDEASAPGSSLKKSAPVDKRKDKEYESSVEKATLVEYRKEKEYEQSVKKARLDESKHEIPESRLKKPAVEKKKPKESERSLKDVLEKQWSNCGKEKGNESSNSMRHNLEDGDLQSLIKYLVTKKRPDKETIKKIVSLTRTKLSKLEEMEVDTEVSEEEEERKKSASKGETESRRVISEVEARRVISRAEPSKATSKVEPRRVISKKSASELKSEIIQTMKRNAEEHENEVRRAAKVLKRRDVENEEEEGDVQKEWTSRRREEEEMRIRDASREEEKKMRTEQLLKSGKVFWPSLCFQWAPYM